MRDNGANCEGREEEFSGAHLPSDEWAERECLGCPSYAECAVFLKIGRPAYGVFAGTVVGRALDWDEDVLDSNPQEKEGNNDQEL